MSLSHSILGFLSYGSMTGYELAKAFSSSIRFFWYAQASHIYLELNKLEKKELVTCEIIVQTDKPSKKLYTITQEGKREFLSWLSKENNEFNKGSKNAFLMKVFFSGCRAPEENIAMLKEFIRDCEAYSDELSHVPKTTEQYGELVDKRETLYWQLTADFGNSYIKMCIDWANRSIKKMEEIQ